MPSPDSIPDLLARPGSHVHLAGICGVGMAGLAVLLKARGLRVTGCDAAVNRLGPWLQERGIEVLGPHRPAHVEDGVDWVIRSAAVPADHPEIRAAVDRGIPVSKRGEVLPRLLDGPSVAVAGTHGKTTTTSFIAQVLKATGQPPTFCIGGEVEPLGGVAGIGTSGLTVAEADESDGTLALYAPEIAVVTNIEFDHMEHFAGVEAFEDCFLTFIEHTRRRVIYCADDPRAARLCGGHLLARGYGLGETAALRALALAPDSTGTSFNVLYDGAALGRFRVPAPGRHNVLNALACIGVALDLGVPPEALREALAVVALPRRRFDRLVDREDVVVISDYAHHPSEIAALIVTAAELRRTRLLGVFQPHRYTRTRALGPLFPPAFDGLSELVLTPVYAASELPLEGGSTWDLYAQCRAHGTTPVRLARSLDQAWEYCQSQLQLGDALLVIGAGDIERLAFQARDALRERRVDQLDVLLRRVIRELELTDSFVRGHEPLARKTTLGVGGAADVWIEFGTVADLRHVLTWTHANRIPFTLLGGGSNVLVSDLGVRGVVGRLTGDPFRAIRMESDTVVVAGAGVPIAQLLSWTEAQSLGGLEFLHHVPGTVGGAVHGNAGAWGQAIGDHVAWVQTLGADGAEQRFARAELDYAYRSCATLRDRVIVEVALQLAPVDGVRLRGAKAAFAARRAWMKGLRCAGSIFKNPPGNSAGRLIEQAGLKGRHIGGARIYEEHANVIVTNATATASDVLALLETARAAVRDKFSVTLEPEIRILE